MTLTEIRKQIDIIDNEILSLLLKRMKCSECIAKIKLADKLPVLDEAREKDILNNIKINSSDKYKYVLPIFNEILKTSKDIQNDFIFTHKTQ